MLRKAVICLILLAIGLPVVAPIQGCGEKNLVGPKATEVVLTTVIPPDSVQGQINKPGAVTKAAAPVISGFRMVKATTVVKIVDRNENDDDYLITFDLPIYYCPSTWKVYAMTWYGVWYEQTVRLQPYGFSATGSGYRMRFIYGNGKAWQYGIWMSPSNWALYFR